MNRSLTSILKNKSLKRLTGETLWIFFSRIAVGLGMFVTTRVVTELVNPDVFGVIGMLLAGELMLKQFLCDPIILASPRIIADHLIKDGQQISSYQASSKLLWVAILSSSVIGFLVVISGNGNRWNIDFYSISALLFLHFVFTRRSLETGILNAVRKQKHFSLWIGLEPWLKVLFAALACFVFGNNATSVIGGYAFGILACYILFIGKLEPPLKSRFTEPLKNKAKAASKEILKMAVPLMPGGVAIWVTLFGDRLLVGHFLGSEQAGLYIANAAPVGVPIAMLGGIISSALLPILYRYSSEGKQDELIKIRWIWFSLILLWGTVAVIAVALLSDWIAILALAEEYRHASFIMPYIAAAFAFYSLAQSCENILMANKHTSYVMICQITGAVVQVSLLLLLITPYGILGVAIAKMIGYLIEAIMAFILSTKSAKIMQMSNQ